MPGVILPWPIVGGLLDMVFNPLEFYKKQEKYGPISCTMILGKLFVFVRDPQISKTVFDNSEGHFRLYLHLNAEKILGSNNIAFMQGGSKEHKKLRVELLKLFHKRAMAKYLAIQNQMIEKHLAKWTNDPMKEIRTRIRDLNIETSISVFLGSYLSENERQEFRREYLKMNDGLLALPINLPGTTLHKAIEARKNVIKDLIKVVDLSQKAMEIENAEPQCLLDEWMFSVMRSQDQKSFLEDYAFHMLDFLFASQDASTSSLVWVFHLLGKYPSIWKTIVEEQCNLRKDANDPITLELLDQMTTTGLFIKELLRFRPPAISVPHIAQEDTELSDYRIPKGSIIFPSIWSAHNTTDGFENPHIFDINRFKGDPNETRNFLAFGKNHHSCLGKIYALNQLKAFTSILTRKYHFERQVTPTMDDIGFCPTIVPKDDCPVKITKLEISCS